MKASVYRKNCRWYRWIMSLLVIAAVLGMSELALAADSLSTIATNITSTFKGLAKLITALAYVAGLGFAVGAIFKFKAHKDNPTQIPVGTPIALLFVGAALIFMPNVFTVAGQTVFGNTSAVGGATGTDPFGA